MQKIENNKYHLDGSTNGRVPNDLRESIEHLKISFTITSTYVRKYSLITHR